MRSFDRLARFSIFRYLYNRYTYAVSTFRMWHNSTPPNVVVLFWIAIFSFPFSVFISLASILSSNSNPYLAYIIGAVSAFAIILFLVFLFILLSTYDNIWKLLYSSEDHSRHFMNTINTNYDNRMLVIEFLCHKYDSIASNSGAIIMQVKDVLYPVVFFNSINADPRALFHNTQESNREDAFTVSSHVYPRLIRSRARNILISNSGDIFCMGNICIENDTPIICNYYRAVYLDVMDRSHSLTDEILFEFATSRKELPFELRESRLHWRNQLHNAANIANENILLSANTRDAGIGVAMLTLYLDENNSWLPLIMKRSTNVGTWPEVLHVIPSGMLNAYGSFGFENLMHCLRTEYLEELFSKEEFEHYNLNRRVDIGGYLENNANYNKAKGSLDIYFSGIAIDLYNLRPELCFVAFDKNLSAKDIYLNKESEKLIIPDSYTLSEAKTNIGAFDDNFIAMMSPDQSVPSGAAAFYYGSILAAKIACNM